MFAVVNFSKTVFECVRIAKSVLYEHRGFFLLAATSKNCFVLSFCKLTYNFRNFVRCVST